MPAAVTLVATLLLMAAIGFWLAARSRGKQEKLAIWLVIVAAIAVIVLSGLSIAGA